MTHSVRSLSLLLFSNSFSFSLLHTFERANHGFSLSFARGVNHGKRSSLFQNAFETRLLVPGIGVYAWNYGLARKKRAFENITRSRPKKGSQSFPPIPGQTRNTLFSSTLPPIVTKQLIRPLYPFYLRVRLRRNKYREGRARNEGKKIRKTRGGTKETKDEVKLIYLPIISYIDGAIDIRSIENYSRCPRRGGI